MLDDDFSSIVRAVRLGRRIYDNIEKATVYVLAIHVPMAGISLIPVLFGWPLVLMPVHVIFMELIIDPTCSIAFETEPEQTDVMRRPRGHGVATTTRLRNRMGFPVDHQAAAARVSAIGVYHAPS